jgi:hypothetical protein
VSSGRRGSSGRGSLDAGGRSGEVRAVVGKAGLDKAGRERAARQRNIKQTGSRNQRTSSGTAGSLVVGRSRNAHKKEKDEARREGLYSQNRGTQIVLQAR